jgi:tRNA(fMet)-specific endonuclease VapC
LKKYLLDTNICIYYFKGLNNLDQKFKEVDPSNCFISEITLAELKYGVENSLQKDKNQKVLNNFLSSIKVLPIIHSLDFYAKEKTRLRKSGKQIDDFDLLIGSTSVVHELIMVTNNTKEFKRINNIILEDWTKE